MGRFKMAACTLGIGGASRKMKQRSSKSLQTISFCYSNAKCTVLVTLTFIKVAKNKQEDFNFVPPFFLLSPISTTQKLHVYGVCK